MKQVLVLLCVVGLVASCQRSRSEVWQDSKSCGRHMMLAFKSLGGKHPQSKQVHSRQEFAGPAESDFIPLHERYAQVSVTSIESDTAVPQSSLSPGEGSIPGISGFSDPVDGELARIFKKIHFETDDYVIRGEENLRYIKQIATYLKRHPHMYVFIEGHCDERGAAAYNLALGARRSNSVRNQLIKNGIDLNRLFTVSYGKEKPLVQGGGDKNLRQNRRAQFKVYAHS